MSGVQYGCDCIRHDHRLLQALRTLAARVLPPGGAVWVSAAAARARGCRSPPCPQTLTPRHAHWVRLRCASLRLLRHHCPRGRCARGLCAAAPAPGLARLWA